MTEGVSAFGLIQEIINNFGDESIAGDSVLNQEDQEIPLKQKTRKRQKKSSSFYGIMLPMLQDVCKILTYSNKDLQQ